MCYIHLTEDCDNYQLGPFEATFPMGKTSAIVTINVTDDDVYEENESFELSIVNSNPPNLVILGDQVTAKVVIEEDEEC